MKNFFKSHFLKYLFPSIFYCLIVIFLAIYLSSLDISVIRSIDFSLFYLFIATLFALGFRYWGVGIWIYILKSLGATQLEHKGELALVYAKSWLGRYLPTPAAWLMGKVYFASKHGISKNKLAVSSLLEAGLQIIVVMVVALLMLVFDRRFDVIDPRFKAALFLLACLGLIAITPKVFNFIISFSYKAFRKKKLDPEHKVNGSIIVRSSALYVVGSLLSGASLFFIAKSVYPQLSYADAFFVVGVGNLSAAASMLAIFAPSGLGVREGIQLFLLSMIMPGEYALIITIMTRLWGIGVDFLFFLLAKLLAKN